MKTSQSVCLTLLCCAALCAACDFGMELDDYDSDRDGQRVLIGINAGEPQCGPPMPISVNTAIQELRQGGIRVFAATNCLDTTMNAPCCSCAAFRGIGAEVSLNQADLALDFLGPFGSGSIRSTDVDCSTCYYGHSNDRLVEIDCPFAEDAYNYYRNP